MHILKMSLLIFVVQLIFIWTRTWNVKAIAKENISQVLISGAIIHLAWLASISIGSVSMYKIILDWKLEYSPIVICSLIGGLIGSYIGMKSKK